MRLITYTSVLTSLDKGNILKVMQNPQRVRVNWNGRSYIDFHLPWKKVVIHSICRLLFRVFNNCWSCSVPFSWDWKNSTKRRKESLEEKDLKYFLVLNELLVIWWGEKICLKVIQIIQKIKLRTNGYSRERNVSYRHFLTWKLRNNFFR